MKQIILIIICFCSAYMLSGQTKNNNEFHGKVIYKILNSDDLETVKAKIEKATMGNGENAKEYGNIMMGMERKRSEIEFELIFNKSQSIFRHKGVLIEDNPIEKLQYNIAVSTSSGGYTYYKNLQEKEKVSQINKSGQLINIQQDFNFLDWKITGEEKKIGNYNCLKAITSLGTLDRNNEKVMKEYTAWFTPEIPFPFGPSGIDGLPGLVLEASKNGQIFFCAIEVEVGANVVIDDSEIELPKGGKTISEDKWNQINREEYQRIKQRH